MSAKENHMTRTLPKATTEAVGVEDASPQPKWTGADFLTKRPISHDEADEIAQRLINSHFRKEPHARASIPAKPDYDDDLDLLISAYIRQQRTAHDDLVKALEFYAKSENYRALHFNEARKDGDPIVSSRCGGGTIYASAGYALPRTVTDCGAIARAALARSKAQGA